MKETLKNPTLVKGSWVSLAEMQKLVGKYIGKWGGYVVSFKVEGVEYTFQTSIGIRLQQARCVVTINEDGTISVEL
jgi:hypothetical protein